MNITSIIIYVAAAVEIIIGVTVFLNNKKDRVNQLFSIVALVTAYWIVTNALTVLSPSDFWVKNSYATGIFVAPFILIWIDRFITEKKISTLKIFVIFFPAVIFFILTNFTNLIIEKIDVVLVGGFEGSFGYLFPLFSLYFIITSVYILYLITKAYYGAKGIKKIQYGYIAFGLYGFGFITTVVSFILPAIGFESLIPLDAPSSIFFIAAMSFAILRHNLFNVKVIATELLVFSLWIIILTRTVIAENLSDKLINGSLLLLTIVIGTFLIRSVIKEVAQREKIEKLATDLQKANDRLTELDKQKSEFVSFATHQLRAPLTAMKGYASLILEGDLGDLSKQIKEAISRIFDSSTTLTNIVDDYLNISRIELGTMKYAFETIDLRGLIDNVIGELKPNIEKSKLAFSFDADPQKKYMVNVDKDKFKQIIANLIDNSMKYTPTGTVKVSLEKKAGTDGRKIVFSVKDTGIGIAEGVMPKLFAKFSRAENGTRQNIHGTGLGLFVAKEIVMAHKGKIWAESAGEGKGSAFFVELEEVI